jgi:DNA-binding transcriptional LysR family regulator
VNFTLKQMRYFEAAGRHGSIAAAAVELNISQSSISAAIDALEGHLGVDLFIRQPAKGIVPTPAGRQAMDMVRSALSQFGHLQSELASLRGSPRGTLRLGCYQTVAPFVLPPLLKAFSDRYPAARIDLREGDMGMMADLLRAGEIDLALTYAVPDMRNLEFMPLFDARPYALVSADDPLAQSRAVRLAELAERPLVLLDLPHTKEYFQRIFQAQGLSMNVAHSSRSSEIVRALVAGGFGVSILNVRSGREEIDGSGYRCLPLADEVQTPVFGVARLPDLRLPLMSRVFLELSEALRTEGAFHGLTVSAVDAGPPPSSDFPKASGH